MNNVIDETLLQVYLLDLLVKVTIETRGNDYLFRFSKMNSVKHYIESTLITLHKAGLINTETYNRLNRYFSKISISDCEI